MDRKKPLSPYEVEQRKIAESAKRAKHHDDEMRERAKATAANIAAAEAQAAAFRADELQRYLAAGGTEATFNANWPRLRQTLVEQAYLQNRTQAPGPINAAQKALDVYYGKPRP